MRQRDYFETQARAGLPLTEAVVIDAHGHLGENPNYPLVDSGPDTVVAAMDRIGVQVICISGIAGCYGNVAVGNRVVLDAVARYPERIFGLAMANPAYPQDMGRELERCWAGGMRGTKIHSSAGPAYDHINYKRLFEMTNERGLPLLAHTWGNPELDALEPQFARYPRINFLLGHSGAAARERYVQLGREYPNVYLELAFSQCPRGLVEYFVGEGLAHKTLWGSDASFMSMEQQVGRVLFAQISEQDKRMIMGETAARVLGLTELG